MQNSSVQSSLLLWRLGKHPLRVKDTFQSHLINGHVDHHANAQDNTNTTDSANNVSELRSETSIRFTTHTELHPSQWQKHTHKMPQPFAV
jgi:hypothetical protein